MGKSTSQGTVLVTGASGGIGEATSLYLARRGYRVLATSRELSRLGDLVERAGAESLPISGHQLDINDPLSVRDVVPGLISDAGPLRALVNNAGYGLLGFLEDLRVEELRSLFETNLFAVHRMTQAVLPHMRHRGQGTIVNVGSISGQVGTPAGVGVRSQQVRPQRPHPCVAYGGRPVRGPSRPYRTRSFSHRLSPEPRDGGADVGPGIAVL